MNCIRVLCLILALTMFTGCVGKSREEFDPQSMSYRDQTRYFMRQGLEAMERGYEADYRRDAAQEFDTAIFAFSRAHDAYLNRLLEVKEGEKHVVEQEIDKVQHFLFQCRKERPALKEDLDE